jgi:hypothetical protein
MSNSLPAIREVILDGVRCPLAGTDGRVQFSDLARFQPKMLFGDPSKDDNDLLSSWQIDNLAGGHGVFDMKEGTDAGRYWLGSMATRFPGQITKPPFVSFSQLSTLEGTGDKMVLGEMWSIDHLEFFVVFTAGLTVRRGWINNGLLSTFSGFPSSAGNLTTLPVNPGVAFQGTHNEERFFIPQGNAGYATITDSSTSVSEFSDPKFRSFTVWDNKLVGITTGGRLYKTTDGTTWIAYDLTFALSKSYAVRDLVNFYDRRDEPTIYVITGRDVWQFDPAGPELFRIDYGWAGHPHHGLASVNWNGQLYIAVGMAVLRYTGGTWMPVGLDRDDGLGEYQGYIVALVGGTNALYAMVQGAGADTEYGTKSSIHEYSGSGWQMIWSDDTAVPASDQHHGTLATTAATLKGMVVTQSGGEQTLVWGTGGSDDKIYTMPLNLGFANPRAGIRRGQLFGSGDYYYLETPEFDADMLGYVKINNALQYYLEEPITTGVTDDQRDTLRWLYRADRSDWEVLDERLAKEGRYVAPFGTALDVGDGVPADGATNLYTGLDWEIIQLRFEVRRAFTYHPDKPFVLTNMAMSFLKTVGSNDAFTFAIDCKNGSGDYSPAELAAFIDNLTTIKRFCVLQVGGFAYRVFISQNAGDRYSGDVPDNLRSLSVVEIPLRL